MEDAEKGWGRKKKTQDRIGGRERRHRWERKQSGIRRKGREGNRRESSVKSSTFLFFY